MRKMIFVGTLLISLLSFSIGTSASEAGTYKLANIDQYSKAQFSVDIDKLGNNIVTADTKGLAKGHYTSYIYTSQHMDLSKYAGIWFQVSNQGKSDVSINLNLVDSKGQQTNLRAGVPYLLEDDNIKYAHVTEIEGVRIKAGKAERIYIPFSSLNSQSIEWTRITKLGYLVTIAEDNQCDLSLGSFEWLEPSEAKIYQNSLGAKIVGDSEMQIAVQGESIINLAIDGPKNNTYQFQPLNGIAGMTIASNGRLVSTNAAKEQTITVSAKDAAGVMLTHEVKMYKSWRVSDGVNSLNYFKTAKEIVKPDISFTKYFSASNLIIMRSVGGVIALSLFISYLVIRKKAKKKDKEG